MQPIEELFLFRTLFEATLDKIEAVIASESCSFSEKETKIKEIQEIAKNDDSSYQDRIDHIRNIDINC